MSATWFAVLGCKVQERPARVGMLGNRAIDVPELGAALKDGFRELGWVEGENLVFDWRYADGTEPWLPEVAADLASSVDIVIADHGPAALAVQRASSTMPIVLTNHPDPVAAGLVASFGRPGGTITGHGGSAGPASKKIQLLKELVLTLRRLGVLINPDFSDRVALRIHVPQAYKAAQSLDLEVVVAESREQADLPATLERLVRERVDGLTVHDSPNVVAGRSASVAFAAAARIPAVYPNVVWVEAGGLMSYGVSTP